MILPGITLAEGTAVGANSLVTQDTESWTMYFGSPAKKIKPRSKRFLEMEKEDLAQELDTRHRKE